MFGVGCYFNRIYLNVSFSTKWLASHLRNPKGELKSKVELVDNIFEGIDFSITIALVVHDDRDQRPNELS